MQRLLPVLIAAALAGCTSVPSPRPEPVACIRDRLYVVLFTWDSAELSAETRETIAKAVAAAKSGKTVHILILNHCDNIVACQNQMRAFGPPRAAAVRAEMLRLGFPRRAILTVDEEREPPPKGIECNPGTAPGAIIHMTSK